MKKETLTSALCLIPLLSLTSWGNQKFELKKCKGSFVTQTTTRVADANMSLFTYRADVERCTNIEFFDRRTGLSLGRLRRSSSQPKPTGRVLVPFRFTKSVLYREEGMNPAEVTAFIASSRAAASQGGRGIYDRVNFRVPDLSVIVKILETTRFPHRVWISPEGDRILAKSTNSPMNATALDEPSPDGSILVSTSRSFSLVKALEELAKNHSENEALSDYLDTVKNADYYRARMEEIKKQLRKAALPESAIEETVFNILALPE